jgi:hypothetical protein
MKKIFMILIIYILMNRIVNGIANDRVIERANEVSEERINNNIIWRNDIWINLK